MQVCLQNAPSDHWYERQPLCHGLTLNRRLLRRAEDQSSCRIVAVIIRFKTEVSRVSVHKAIGLMHQKWDYQRAANYLQSTKVIC